MKPSVEKKLKPCTDELFQARREEILETATHLFAECGYSDCVTQALADRLQVGKGTIYRYFPSKQDLFLAAADRAMRRLHERLGQSIVGIADPVEQIERGVTAYLEFFAEHPEFVEMLIQERAHFKDRPEPTYFEHRLRNVERWHELYRAMISEGQVRDIPPERITDVVGNMLYGTMFTNYFLGRRKPFEDQARDLIDILFHGILSDPERARRASEPAEADSAGTSKPTPSS